MPRKEDRASTYSDPSAPSAHALFRAALSTFSTAQREILRVSTHKTFRVHHDPDNHASFANFRHSQGTSGPILSLLRPTHNSPPPSPVHKPAGGHEPRD